MFYSQLKVYVSLLKLLNLPVAYISFIHYWFLVLTTFKSTNTNMYFDFFVEQIQYTTKIVEDQTRIMLLSKGLVQ